MKRFIVVYLSTLVVLLPLDFLFLGTIGKKLFNDHVGDLILATARAAPAIIFYLVFLVGVVAFANGSEPGNWSHNLGYGALFGLVCYATFELTNMSILKNWSWAVVAPDVAWGCVLTAVSASVGGLIAQWVLSRV